MQITLVVDDRLVICDGVAVHLPGLDWAKFDGDPTTPWDDVAAVQYNAADKQGHVEYRTIVTHPAGRPNIRPGDRYIGEADFQEEFAWVLPLYVAERERLAAEAALAKAEAEKLAAEQALAAEKASHAPSQPSEANSEDIDALKAELATLKETVAKQQEAFTGLDKLLPGASE